MQWEKGRNRGTIHSVLWSLLHQMTKSTFSLLTPPSLHFLHELSASSNQLVFQDLYPGKWLQCNITFGSKACKQSPFVSTPADVCSWPSTAPLPFQLGQCSYLKRVWCYFIHKQLGTAGGVTGRMGTSKVRPTVKERFVKSQSIVWWDFPFCSSVGFSSLLLASPFSLTFLHMAVAKVRI